MIRECNKCGNIKAFGALHVITVRDFFQMPQVGDAYIFRDGDIDYGNLSVNL